MKWLETLKALLAPVDTRGEQEELRATLQETLRRAKDSPKRFDDLLLIVLKERTPETAWDRHSAIVRLLTEHIPMNKSSEEMWTDAAEKLLVELPKLYGRPE